MNPIIVAVTLGTFWGALAYLAAAGLSRITHDLRTAAGTDPDTEVGR